MTNVRAVGSTFIIRAEGVVVFRSSAVLSGSKSGEVVEEDVARIPFPNLRGGAKLLWASHGRTIISVGFSGHH